MYSNALLFLDLVALNFFQGLLTWMRHLFCFSLMIIGSHHRIVSCHSLRCCYDWQFYFGFTERVSSMIVVALSCLDRKVLGIESFLRDTVLGRCQLGRWGDIDRGECFSLIAATLSCWNWHRYGGRFCIVVLYLKAWTCTIFVRASWLGLLSIVYAHSSRYGWSVFGSKLLVHAWGSYSVHAAAEILACVDDSSFFEEAA